MEKYIKKNRLVGHIVSFSMIVISAFIQSFVIEAFMEPTNFLASGFTGVSQLINKITGVPIPISLLILNIVVASFCYRAISKRFVFYSLLHVALSSFFLNTIDFEPVFSDSGVILNAIFGGFIFGMAIVIALKGRGSSGGTDFIALYVSNKKNKSIWNQVFIFNVILLAIFGFMYEWDYAGYSILFQFISTKTISTFHQRYERVTLQITTSKPDEVIEEYIKNFRHGLSCIEGFGGYSKKKIMLIHTVVSSYEVSEIVENLRQIDPYIIINMLKTQEFYGRFFQKPLD